MYKVILVKIILFFVISVEGRSSYSSHRYPNDVKHFESKLDSTQGFWSPSTSSIDWCERNYIITPYIAEFWNFLSSLLMCLIGGYLLYRGIKDRIELRFILLCLSFIVVGFGSAYFHGTLTHVGQMADELPMVYSMIIWWFILFQMNQLNQNRWIQTSSIVVAIFYGLFWTYVHNLQSFILIFQGHFTLMVLGGIARLIYLYRQVPFRTFHILILLGLYAGILIPASILWLLDQHFCEYFNRTAPFNPQFHAWWHILCAIDCHIGIMCAQCIRYLAKKYDHHKGNKSHSNRFEPEKYLQFKFYFGLPYLQYLNTNEKYY